LESHSPHFLVLVKRLQSLWIKSHVKFLVGYMKEMNLMIMKMIAGDVYHIPSKGPRVRKDPITGLPAIIPLDLRQSMIADSRVMRAVLSVSSLYRVIECEGAVDTSPIVGEFNGVNQSLPMVEISRVLEELPRLYLRGKPNLLSLTSSGPNNKYSVLGYPIDAVAFLKSPKLFINYWCISSELGSNIHRWLMVVALVSFPFYILSMLIGVGSKAILGRLSVKIEPAGKRRIFAITDAWTQSLLSPLHKGIFGILRRLPQDGTFNQDRPLKDLVDRFRGGVLVSYDLSSATDRLPVSLQADILSLFISRPFADAWKALLTERPWYLKGQPLYYTVGQPMGALSSWAMLALTHHVIVRVAAHRVGIIKFSDYAILGDDIVIANKAVADSYLALVTSLGVNVSLHKTLYSERGVCEFAKRLVGANEYTPIGASLAVLASRHWSYIPNLFLDLGSKGMVFQADSIQNLFANRCWEGLNPTTTRKVLTALIGPSGLFVKSWSSVSSMENWARLNIKPRARAATWVSAMAMAETAKVQQFTKEALEVLTWYSFANYNILRLPSLKSGTPIWVIILRDLLSWVLWIPGSLLLLLERVYKVKIRLKVLLYFQKKINECLSIVNPGSYLLYSSLEKAHDKASSSIDEFGQGLYPDINYSMEYLIKMTDEGYKPEAMLSLDKRIGKRTVVFFESEISDYARTINMFNNLQKRAGITNPRTQVTVVTKAKS